MSKTRQLARAVTILRPGRTVLAGADLEYLPNFLCPAEAGKLLNTLLNDVPWQQPVIQIFGRRLQSPRLASWYGDSGAIYRYSGLVNEPLPWLTNLTELRIRIEQRLARSFNSVLLNLYRDGSDSMGWHRDHEPELGKHPVIASISLGGIRRFILRPSRKSDVTKLELLPNHGSLLVMRDTTQSYWQHAVPKTSRAVAPRINLTFRRIIPTVKANDAAEYPIVFNDQ
jgi:alkylated DNA repair dioxygenase AlkB